jgi:hypothetical protein
MMEYARMLEGEGEPFKIQTFLDQLSEMGNIPVSMGIWELTGEKFR